ncbi:MAG: sulfotransferase domain-containing protein [Chitinophagales bacterium]|nr:sulfotransferase domain-containing protein [Chitinophagales bacterium]
MANALKLPNLIIGGVHKAGTTSVFTYLGMHPEVCASIKKEIGFFMPLKYGKNLPPIEEYSKYFVQCNEEKKYFLEASPSYLYGKEFIADSILKECGANTRMIFILRNPADRLFSFYERKKANAYLNSSISFSDFIHTSEKLINTRLEDHREDEEAIYIRGIQEGFYIDYLPVWFDKFGPNLKILFFEELKKDTISFMQSLCNWLDIPFDSYKPEDFKVENQTIAYRNRFLHKTLLFINKKFETLWRKNVSLKRTLRGLYKRVNAEDRKREHMNEEERQYLNTLYQPYNEQLSDFLHKKGITLLPDWLT